ncbi:THAP domain-containing protein 3 isoform X2 [Equus przewalskii]|uniref:THAP domain-containing protein 3 isoform X2 n=1 Tax=Equus przewalskii TaxID=9798 RepID=A0ABM4N4F4_EQUPR
MPRRPAGPAPPAGPAAAIFVRGGRAWRVEMPKSCAARQCCNRYSNRRKQLTFHRFPFSRPELLKEWVLNIGRGNFKPKQHTVICSEHFRPECFSAFGNRKNLKHNAVPTEFAFQEPAQVVSRVGAGERGPGRKADTALEALQLPPSARRPGEQVLPHRPEATKAPSQPASPTGKRKAPKALEGPEAGDAEDVQPPPRPQSRAGRSPGDSRAAELSQTAGLSARSVWEVGHWFQDSGRGPFNPAPATQNGSEACQPPVRIPTPSWVV